jgi:hypothetical protein
MSGDDRLHRLCHPERNEGSGASPVGWAVPTIHPTVLYDVHRIQRGSEGDGVHGTPYPEESVGTAHPTRFDDLRQIRRMRQGVRLQISISQDRGFRVHSWLVTTPDRLGIAVRNRQLLIAPAANGDRMG